MYKSLLSEIETEKAVMFVKTSFTKHLSEKLNLLKISSPLLLASSSGLNDSLSGTEIPISFATKDGHEVEIPQSLAKWKRNEIAEMKLPIGMGLWTNMKAIRQDENDVSPYHSLYVEQFDWEKRISKDQRKMEILKETVKQIYAALLLTLKETQKKYKELSNKLPEEIIFITSEELKEKFPDKSAKERETLFARNTKAYFLIGIGHKLENGKPHDVRAADYDDWNLNGDIILYNQIHDKAMELSSMGIRVDAETFRTQKEISDKDHLFCFDFHDKLSQDKLPFTIGGGVGQSRLILFILEKFHIGEFQRAFWPDWHVREMEKMGVKLK